MSRARRNKY